MSGLNAYFDQVAAKLLSQVEADPRVSNQHEFNGASALQPLFGVTQRRRVVYARHFDMERLDDPSTRIVRLTWYDARYDHPTRSEWRLYYGPELAASLVVGGMLVLAKRNDEMWCFTAGVDTRGAALLSKLFALEGLGQHFERLGADELEQSHVAAAEQLILAELGIAVDYEKSLRDLLFDTFGDSFPTGEKLSSFVRANTFGVDAVRDPDGALLTWARVELELFNAMESAVEREAMDAADGLTEKLAVAMRVFQRRRSRAGKAFEYHLQAVFDAHDITYSANAVTEGSEEPDFIFPSIERYRDPEWPNRWLTMLAAKQTVRDRWRQVLQEAARLERKHLATLDVNLSQNQIREIDAAGIQLVIPVGLHSAYGSEASSQFWTLSQFIARVKTIQRATEGFRPTS